MNLDVSCFTFALFEKLRKHKTQSADVYWNAFTNVLDINSEKEMKKRFVEIDQSKL